MSSSETEDYIEPENVKFFEFSGLVPNVKVSTQEEQFDIAKYPATVSLLACSNKFGQFVAATNKGFIFGLTKTLRTTFYNAENGKTASLPDEKVSVPVTKPIRQIRFSADEKHVLIALEGGNLSIYKTDDIQNQKENVKPVNSFELGNEIADLRPNTEAYGNITAVLYTNQQCALIDFTTGNMECTFPLDNITAICWSFKGKQIVCGKNDGGLEHFDIHGAVKDNLDIPKAMSAGHGDETENRYVCAVLWIDNNVFLAVYARKRTDDEDEYINDGYIINRKPATGAEPVYTRLAEITPIFSTEGRGNHFYMETIRGLGKEIKRLIIIANAASSEVSVVGQNENDEWATWQLSETGMIILPLSENTSLDTFPVGLALDHTADEKLPPFDPAESDVGVDPMPVIYYFNDEGTIGSFHCYNSKLAQRGESYKTVSATSTDAAPPVTTTTPSGFSAFGAAAAGASSNGSFADLLSGKSASPTVTSPGTAGGFGSFGNFGSVAAVSSFSKLGTAAKISPAGFGSFAPTTASAPVFGFGTSLGSATEDKTSSPLFGSTTNFGAAATTTANQSITPAIGSTSSFGATANKTNALPFGSSSNFLSLNKPTSTTSTLGGGGFGSLAKNTVPGATSPATTIPVMSAFGSVNNAALNNNAATTTTTTTTTTTSTTSTTSTTTSAFGATSSLGAGGFGSLSKNTIPGAKSPAGTSAFGNLVSAPAPKPTASITITKSTSQPTVSSAPATTTPKAKSDSTTTTESLAEKLKPTAEDGMAKAYEEIYIAVTDEIEKLKAYHNKLTLTMKANTTLIEAKSTSNISNKNTPWNLNDAEALGKISDELVSNIKCGESGLQQIQQQVNALVQNCRKSMDKKEDIHYLLSKNFDSKLVDILDNRELDAETKNNFLELSSKSEVCDRVLGDFEFRLQESKKRNKIANAHSAGSLSMYTLHRAVRDIEREIKHEQDSLTELGEKIASIKLENSRTKARRGTSAISWEDVSDSDQDDDEYKLTPAVFEQTTSYLRRYQFLDTVSNEISKSGPIFTSIE